VNGVAPPVDPGRYLAILSAAELHRWYLLQEANSVATWGLSRLHTEYWILDILTLAKDWLQGLGVPLSVEDLTEEATPSTCPSDPLLIEPPTVGPVGHTIVSDIIIRFTQDPYVQTEVRLILYYSFLIYLNY